MAGGSDKGKAVTWLLEFEAGLGFVGVIAVALAAAFLFQEWGIRRRARKHERPVLLVNSDDPEDYDIDTALPDTVPVEWING